MDLAHYKIILAYNGSAFAGYQRQANERTVQGELEAALQRLSWPGGSVRSAGRTDAGVHARGQVVSFKLNWEHSAEDLRNALNYYLPFDMAVQSVVKVPEDFHPRFDAIKRHYRYNVICQEVRDPIREVFAWRVWPELVVERMNAAAQNLIGVHDFSAFGSPTSDGGSTIRELFSARWLVEADEARFDISANAFLYHMVRRIVFVLVAIGQGDYPPDLISQSLEGREMPITGLAPAQGLVLEEVIY